MTIDEIMRAAPVIPVLVLEGEQDWAALAETFVAAGLPVLEVTLRTPVALEAIRRMAGVPGAIVGAGTVLNERQLGEAVDAGSRFIVSPGLTESLARSVGQSGVAYLPGVATAGDIMRGLDLGLDRFKFFPAEASGGIAALKALSAPFAQVRFCPTGGIRPDTAAAWLGLDSVLCVGGSWFVKPGDELSVVGERARSASAVTA
jgi:2-dehydro-3-deoxyphosphogluconate aldolase/(4S)-4-hydroxy-2-oxoglutarate aldolase